MYLHVVKLDQIPRFSPGNELAVPDYNATSSSAQPYTISLPVGPSADALNLDTIRGPSSRRLYIRNFQYCEGAIERSFPGRSGGLLLLVAQGDDPGVRAV